MRPAIWSVAAVAGLGWSGCGPGAEAERCAAPREERSVVLSELSFVRRAPDEDVRVDGFDLDGRASTGHDPESCHQRDGVSPDGERGVDNQLAVLLPVIDNATGGAVDSTLQAAINNGQLLVALTAELPPEGCSEEATLVFRRVSGVPFVGADQRLDPGQTFDAMRTEVQTRVPARRVGDVLEAGPFTLALPIALLNAQFTLNLYHARARVLLREDGRAEGIIGGGVSRAEMEAELRKVGNIPDSLVDQMSAVMLLFSDLEPEDGGDCAQLSCAVRFTARPAFINP